MQDKAFFITAGSLTAHDVKDWGKLLSPAADLVFSSPATLAFNSPGARGFGVKRAALSIPGSVMLLFSPRCCARNTRSLGDARLASRIFYLLLDETDIITGRYLSRVVAGVGEICNSLAAKPSAVILCSTCVDALLGTDMEALCKRASRQHGVPVLPCTLYALTRDGHLPPMAAVRRTIYSLLEPTGKDARAMNIIGFFTPLRDDCELYALCKAAGISKIHEIGRCRSLTDYHQMSAANFNLVLHPEARSAAQWLAEKMHMPFIELARCYQPDKIHSQYQMLARILDVSIDDAPQHEQARLELEKFRSDWGGITLAIGESCNADPFELALAFLRNGCRVAEIFACPREDQAAVVRHLAELSPATRIYANTSPSMLFYVPRPAEVDAAIGLDASWYHPECPGLGWCDEAQPFGYAGLRALLRGLSMAAAGNNKDKA